MIQMAAAGIGAKMIDTMAGQNRDAVQFRRQRILNQENNKFNAAEAVKQRAAAAAEQADQQRYNSEQAQVSRLRQAGLNPALLYGGATSSGGISSVGAASASPSSYNPNGTQLDLSGGLSLGSQMDLQSAQVENTRTNTASQAEDVVSKQTTNKYIDAKSQLENWELLEKVNNLIKSGNLMDKDLAWYDGLKLKLMQQIDAQIAESQANAAYTSGAKTANTNADTGLKGAQTVTEGTQQSLNRAQTVTEGTQQSLNRAKTATEKTIQDLNISSEKRNYAEKALAQSHIKNNTAVRDELLRKYDLDKSESDLIISALDKMGLDKGFANALIDIFGEFRRETGKGLGEFFSGDNWLTYLGRRYQADKMDGGQLDDLVDRGQPMGKFYDAVDYGQPIGDLVDRNDVAKTVPSNDNYNSHIKKLWNDFPQQFKDEYSKGLPYMEKKLNKQQLDNFKKDIYYEDDPQKIMEKFYYWYYQCKYDYFSNK